MTRVGSAQLLRAEREGGEAQYLYWKELRILERGEVVRLDGLTPLGVSYHYHPLFITGPFSAIQLYQARSIFMLPTWMTNERARNSLEMDEMMSADHSV